MLEVLLESAQEALRRPPDAGSNVWAVVSGVERMAAATEREGVQRWALLNRGWWWQQ